MNSRIDLKELLVRESEQVEWKEDVADENDVVKTLSAFANDYANLGGGYVVCGARESRDAHGFATVELAGLTASRLEAVKGTVLTRCRDLVDPAIQPRIEELEAAVPERKILVFVQPATRFAHTFRGSKGPPAYFVRNAKETCEARNGILRELLTQKGAEEPWDRRPAPGATVDDLDLLVLRDTLTTMGLLGAGRTVESFLSDSTSFAPLVPSLLVKEPLTDVLRPRNFAILLFGREPQRFIPGAFAFYSIYPGEDRTETRSARHELVGTLIEQARRLRDLLSAECTTQFDKLDPETPNAYRYPQRALHEAMTNVLVHRDYGLVDPSRFTVFSNRIEMLSPGTLPRGVDKAAFQTGKASSKWRNQSLAWIFARLQLAQVEGQGVATILKVTNDEGCPPPEFDVGAEHVRLTLFARKIEAGTADHSAIEFAMTVGDYGSARRRALAVLARFPSDFKAMELLAEASEAGRSGGELREFLRRDRTLVGQLPASTAVWAYRALRKDPIAITEGLPDRLLSRALGSVALLEDAVRALTALLSADLLTEAGHLLADVEANHSDWLHRPRFAGVAAEVFIRMAKKAASVAFNTKTVIGRAKRAKRLCAQLLAKAEAAIGVLRLDGDGDHAGLAPEWQSVAEEIRTRLSSGA